MFEYVRKHAATCAGLATLAVAAAVPFTISSTSERAVAETALAVPQLAYEIPASVIADDQVVAAQIRDTALSDALPADEAVAAPAPVASPAVQRAAADEGELECIAKVVHHEASNQSRLGQLAVAQLIVNRMESGRFPPTACGVANQRGQFFPTAGYNPARDTDRWHSAMDVAREALAGHGQDVLPGAIFYHAAYQQPTSWFRTRTVVGTVGDHIFYR